MDIPDKSIFQQWLEHLFIGNDAGLIQFLILLLVGWGVGSFIERRHYRSIMEREEQMRAFPMASFGKNANSRKEVKEARLVVGMACISTDFYKRFIAFLMNIFGGNIRSYESLLDRARREALLRMRAQAEGADIVVNVRVENSNLFVSSGKGYAVGSLEVMAYGTAITFEEKHEAV